MRHVVKKLCFRGTVFSLLLTLLLLPTFPATGEPGATTAQPVPNKNGRYLFSVTLHTRNEIESLLTRAESLSHSLKPRKKTQAGIALVLHGSEIGMFDKKNYGKFRNIVDKAARLDASDVLEIKVCKTLMDDMNIKKEDMPSFVEIVPFGPDEEKRLLRNGYTYL
jgi:hypothetical protein